MGMIPSKKVFVSSTTKDLWQYRQEAERLIDRLNEEYIGRFQLEKVTMGTKPLDGERKTPVNRSRAWVKECDWFVLIVAWNYGFVHEGENRSVTEWEYWEAEENDKPCFVFLAGEESDGKHDEYYYDKNREEENLAKWKEYGKVPEEHIQLLNKFKKELRKSDVKLFTGIDSFLYQLEKGLKEKIKTEPVPEEPHPDFILELIYDLQRPIEKCILRVKQLENYKEIHDLLHDMRQKVIRPLREGIMPKWEQLEGSLPMSKERQLRNRIAEGYAIQGMISVIMKTIMGKNPELFQQLEMIANAKLLTDEDDTDLIFEDFSRKLFDLEYVVQTAFTGANTLMTRQANLLERFHQDLQKEINDRRVTNGLTAEQNRQLDVELDRIQTQREQLLEAITIHDNWQNIHDSLEIVDSFKDTKHFESRLKQFCSVQNIAFTNAITNENNRAEYEKRDNTILDPLEKLHAYWTDLKNTLSIEQYEAMRKEFDDVFYKLDKRTLNEVGKAGACATEFKQLLDKLRDR